MPDYSYQFYKTTSEAWDAMFESLKSATKSIYWEVYIFIDDEIGNKFLEILAEKARAGVIVKMIIDAYGSAEFSASAEKFCTKAGVEVLRYNRMYPELKIWSWIYRLLHRNHRKVLIIDEETVFLGGVNVRAHFQNWGDLYMKISGRTTRPLLRGFAKSYISSGGNRKNVLHLLHPKIANVIPVLKQKLKFIMYSASSAPIPRSKQFYLQAISMAKESVNLLTPYYVPDIQFLRAMALAKKRGVKVNIFLPLRPDLKIMELLARTYYDLTAKAGATIYLLPTMNHGKAMSVDNKLGMVGSINITPRSFSHNEESAVSFTEEEMVKNLNVLFNDWKTTAQPLNMEEWGHRNWFFRMRDWVIKKLEYFV